jgi:hypothetical protein
MGHDGVEARIVLDLWGLWCVAWGMKQRLCIGQSARLIARLGSSIGSLKCSSVLFSAVMLGMLSVDALGQPGLEELRPPKSDSAGGGPQFMVYGIVLILFGAVIFIASKKSKRTHQD